MKGKNIFEGNKSVTPGPGQYNESLNHMMKNPSWKYIILKRF